MFSITDSVERQMKAPLVLGVMGARSTSVSLEGKGRTARGDGGVG